jgi:hypothetical protein
MSLWSQLSQMFCSNLSESPSCGQINLTMGFRGPQPELTLPDDRYRIIMPGADVVVIRTAEEQRQPASALDKRFDSGWFFSQTHKPKLTFAASLLAKNSWVKMKKKHCSVGFYGDSSEM